MAGATADAEHEQPPTFRTNLREALGHRVYLLGIDGLRERGSGLEIALGVPGGRHAGELSRAGPVHGLVAAACEGVQLQSPRLRRNGLILLHARLA